MSEQPETATVAYPRLSGDGTPKGLRLALEHNERRRLEQHVCLGVDNDTLDGLRMGLAGMIELHPEMLRGAPI